MYRVEDHTGDKRCSSCGTVKPRDAYYRSARAKDGRQARCKVCHSAAVRASRARHAEENDRRGRPAVDEKRCSGCRQMKPASAFHRNRTTADGLHLGVDRDGPL